MIDLEKKLKEVNYMAIKLIKDDVRVIQELLAFADLQVVTELSIKNLLKNIGITGTPSELLGFKNKLIQLLHKLPVVMFKNSDEHKAKIIQGVRKTFYTTNVQEDGVEFSFLRKDRTPITYI